MASGTILPRQHGGTKIVALAPEDLAGRGEARQVECSTVYVSIGHYLEEPPIERINDATVNARSDRRMA